MTPVCFTEVSSVDLDRLHAVADLDRVDDLHAVDHPAERGVLAVEMLGCAEHDVELAARRVGIALPRHPEQAAGELPLVELGLDRVPRAARPHCRMIQRERLRRRGPGLAHEPRLYAGGGLSV